MINGVISQNDDNIWEIDTVVNAGAGGSSKLKADFSSANHGTWTNPYVALEQYGVTACAQFFCDPYDVYDMIMTDTAGNTYEYLNSVEVGWKAGKNSLNCASLQSASSGHVQVGYQCTY